MVLNNDERQRYETHVCDVIIHYRYLLYTTLNYLLGATDYMLDVVAQMHISCANSAALGASIWHTAGTLQSLSLPWSLSFLTAPYRFPGHPKAIQLAVLHFAVDTSLTCRHLHLVPGA